MTELLRPPAAANRLLHIVDAFCSGHGFDKFPINVEMLAYEAAQIFKWNDPITEFIPVNVKKFDGALLKNNDKNKWAILYNPETESMGRVLFTKAHELGHYILHKTLKNSFECGSNEMYNFTTQEVDIENEANTFASYLLMPFDDYKKQIDSTITLKCFSECAKRYGVSLTAAILRWLDYTEENALLILSNDGFMKWAYSSKKARKSGAFFRTRTNTIEIPELSICANTFIELDEVGTEIKANVWFEHAHKDIVLKEFKMYSEKFDLTLTLLLLPRQADVWKERKPLW